MFNSTYNFSISHLSPHYEAHKSFIVETDAVRCLYIMDLPWSEMCNFIKQHPHCHELTWAINWMKFMFCDMHMDMPTFITMISIMLCFVIMGILSLVIISYVRLAPAFIAAAHFFKFDEHMAGSFFLVIIAYSSDIVENADMYHIDTVTAFNEALGSNLMTVGLFGGIVLVIYQFQIHPPYFIRDWFFVFIGLLFTTVVYMHEHIDLEYSLGIMGIYFLYLVYIAIEFLAIQRTYRLAYMASKEQGLDYDERNMLPQHQPIQLKFDVNDDLQYGELEGANEKIFLQFFQSINPVRFDLFKDMNIFYKSCFLIGMPLHVLVNLCIPCFDYTLPNHGWSKLLACFHIVVTGPLLAIVFLPKPIIYAYAIIPGVLVAIAVFFTSRTDRPPKYHLVFAFHCLLMCMTFQFVLEHELMNIFHAFGIFMRISRSTAALSIVAIGDNITTAVWISRIAAWGYPRLAFAALFASPLLDTIYSIGLIFTLKTWESWKLSIIARPAVLGPTGALYALSLYAFIFFAVALSSFQIRKSFGFGLIIIYITYLLTCFLAEYQVIHGMGTDHSSTNDVENVDWA